uniref:Uncharacterized protein n=1 Tax=Solanum tuberosum TaxID=4113 RepID=M1DS77_SOLTU
MIAYGARELPIGVYRLIGTFRAYGVLSRWFCELYRPAELMGAWVGCCFIIFDKFRFKSRPRVRLGPLMVLEEERRLTTDAAELKIGIQSMRDLNAKDLNLHHEKM